MIYVQFLTTDTNGKLSEALGSDGVFILDGRNKLKVMEIDAIERLHKLRNVQPHYIGYKIYKGQRIADGNTVLCEWVRSGAKYKR